MDHAQIISILATAIAIMARADDAMPGDCEALYTFTEGTDCRLLLESVAVGCNACEQSVSVEDSGGATFAIIRAFTSHHRRCSSRTELSPELLARIDER